MRHSIIIALGLICASAHAADTSGVKATKPEPGFSLTPEEQEMVRKGREEFDKDRKRPQGAVNQHMADKMQSTFSDPAPAKPRKPGAKKLKSGALGQTGVH